MANYCSTDIQIYGEKDKIAALYKEFEKAKAIDNDGYSFWEGNMLQHCGMSKEEIENGNAPRCRGSVTYMDLEGNDKIVIAQEDAWSPNLGPVMVMLAKFYPDASLFYTAIEPGCDLFYSNDSDYAGKYLIDQWEPESVPAPLGNYDYDFFSEQEIRKMLIEALNAPKDTPTTDLLIKYEYEYGEYGSIHHIEYADASDFAWN